MKIFNIKSRYYLLLLTPLLLVNCSCDDDDPAPPPTIDISGTITSSANGMALENAQVKIVNVETQQYELDPAITDKTGMYAFTVPTGSYEIRAAAQDYMPSPLDGVAGIPLSTTQTYDVALNPITAGPYGWLNIQLVGYSQSSGALVIMKDASTLKSYTAVTSSSGSIIMYNLPAGDYGLTIKSVGHATYTSTSNITISDGVETLVNNITLTAIDGFTVSGTVTFLAVENSEVDVSLTDKETGAVIPGTNVNTVSTNYTMSGIAPGSYYIRATYNIDGLVVDPDSIVKFGEPEVTVVAADMPGQDIDVTGAVTLSSPIVQTDGTPAEVATLTPTLSWVKYPSTTDYVVEVLDINGNVIWGGFADDANHTKQVVTVNNSITYNNDAMGQVLVDGEVYRWKVYASKDDNTPPTNWSLISSSEEAQGIFKVVLP